MQAIRPIIVASDVHLSLEATHDTAHALARLLRTHSGHEVVLAGDVFNLSWEPAGGSSVTAVLSLLRAYPDLRLALREHLSAGHPLTLIAGNHDAELLEPELRSALLDELALTSEAPLGISAWFVRRGGIHIEHGHFYDPDNAPAHPLAQWSVDTEPLGVAITRRFVRPSGAHHFSHAHETTPLAGISKAFRLYGARTPVIISDWFKVAARLCMETRAARRFEAEQRAGEAALENFARLVEIDPEILRVLLKTGAVPTHRDFLKTFMRLYFDRVFATSGGFLGAAAYLAWKSRAAGVLSLLAGLYLLQSVQRTGNRYEDLPVERLRHAAGRVRELTGAQSVIFGHTHHVDQAPGYANSGSFGYSNQGRPYVHVSERADVKLRRS